MSPRRRRTTRPPARGPLPRWVSAEGTDHEVIDGLEVEVRTIQPYQALKPYTCPGCHGTIAAHTGHVVAVPLVAPDDRRHWHRSCWQRRTHRRPR